MEEGKAEEDEYESRKKSKVKKKKYKTSWNVPNMKWSIGRKYKNYGNYKSSMRRWWGENLFLNYK